MESLVLSCGGGGKKAMDEGQRGEGQRWPRQGQMPLCLGHRLQLLPCGGGADEETMDEKMQGDRVKHRHHHHHHQLHQLQFQQQQPSGYLSRKLSRFELNEHYVILRHIGSGTFGNVLLALCVKDQAKVALKKLPKASTKLDDFLREFHYSFRLAAHPVVVKTFDVVFETRTSYVFAQEYAPRSDLLKCVPPRIGLSECKSKAVARQIASALEYIHAREIVHRDVKLENILVFDEKLFRVKLADFGVARQEGTIVCKVCSGTTYTPPEICDQPKGRNYCVETGADVWSFGVVIFCLLTGSFPWQMAEFDGDPLFDCFAFWQTGRTDQVPEHWSRFTPVLMRLFRHILEIRPKKRSPVQVVFKYTEHTWVVRTPRVDQDHALRRGGRRDGEDQCVECRDDEKGEGRERDDHQGGESKAHKHERLAKVNDWLLKQVSSSSSSAF